MGSAAAECGLRSNRASSVLSAAGYHGGAPPVENLHADALELLLVLLAADDWLPPRLACRWQAGGWLGCET